MLRQLCLGRYPVGGLTQSNAMATLCLQVSIGRPNAKQCFGNFVFTGLSHSHIGHPGHEAMLRQLRVYRCPIGGLTQKQCYDSSVFTGICRPRRMQLRLAGSFAQWRFGRPGHKAMLSNFVSTELHSRQFCAWQKRSAGNVHAALPLSAAFSTGSTASRRLRCSAPTHP